MDMSAILPLLMQQNGGGNDRTAMLVNAMSAMRGGNASNATENAAQSAGGNDRLAQMLSMMNGNNKSAAGNANPADILSMMNGANGSGGQNPNLGLVNLLSNMNKNNRNVKRPYGLKPVKSFIPDEILGKMVKYFNK